MELARLIARAMQYDGTIGWDASQPDGAVRKPLNISKLNRLGWKATTQLAK